jgi:pyruvate formate lyase activating enzyme
MYCNRCEFLCSLTQKWSGKCGMYRVSKNSDETEKLENRFYAENLVSEMTAQPIETVPIFHFKPGTRVINIGTAGCNFDCKYCINERLAKKKPEEINFSSQTPAQILDRAYATKASAVFFGHNEPVVSLDYVLDLAKECAKYNLPFGISTNGFMTKSSMDALLEIGVTLVNMDIKSFNPSFLRDVIGLEEKAEQAKSIFIRNLTQFADAECVKVLEVTTPIIYQMNDSEVLDIAKEIAQIDPKIPYHLQRMVPEYKFKGETAPEGDIEAMKEYYFKVSDILEYVYFGAFPNTPYVDTYCINCNKPIIKRADFGGCYAQATLLAINGNKCKYCGEKNHILV